MLVSDSLPMSFAVKGVGKLPDMPDQPAAAPDCAWGLLPVELWTDILFKSLDCMDCHQEAGLQHCILHPKSLAPLIRVSSVCKRLAAAAVLLLCTREGLDLSFPDPSLKYEMDYKYPEGYFIEHPHLLPFQYRLNCSRFLQWAPLLCKLSIDEYAISRQAFPDFMANAKALRELSVSCTTQMALAKVPSLRSLTVQYPDSLTGTTVLPWLEDLTLETCIGTEQSDPGPSAFTWFWEQPCKRKHLVVFVNTCGDGPEDPYRGEPDWHDEFLTGLPQNQLSSVTLSVQMWDPPPSSSLLQRWQALTISGEVNIIDMPWP